MTLSAAATRFVRFAPALALAAMLLGHAQPASATVSCFTTLHQCYYQAALKEDWMTMWLAGLDCELDFTDCTRRAIIGR